MFGVIAAVGFLGLPARAWEAQNAVARSILVTALDARGAPVKGLTPRDFVVRDDGGTREVLSVEAPTEPLFISLLVDNAKPPMGQNLPLRDLRLALKTFVATIHAAAPNSEIAYMEIAGAAMPVVKFTTDTAKLTSAVGRVTESQRSFSVLFEALQDVSKELSKHLSPRRAIVTVTFDSPESSHIDPAIPAADVQRAGAQFWSIAINDSSSRGPLFDMLPSVTGGDRMTAVTATSLESMLKKVADALTSQYVVTYARPGGVAALPTVGAKGAAKTFVARYAR
jgi:hypothetical protein